MDDDKKTDFWKRKTFKDQIDYLRKNITCEPLLMCFVMPSMITSLATQNLYLEKACRISLEYNSTVCDALTARETANYTTEELEVQTLVAEISGYRAAIQSALPCLLIMFWGSWSDRHRRRKPCMLIPLIGEMLSAVGLLLCVYFSNSTLVTTVFAEVIFPALTGGWFTMLMGMYSYMADITTKEERTFRIGLLTLCLQIGVPIGLSVSGILLKKIGFYGVYLTSITLQLAAFTYGIFCLKDSPRLPVEPSKNGKQKSLLADFFDRTHIYETFRVAFKQGKKNRRAKVVMLSIVVMLVMGPFYGEQAVVYLFTRLQFNWSEIEFSIFSTIQVTINTIGVLLSVGFLSAYLKMDDAFIGIISSSSKILSSLVYGFSVQPWQMYAGSAVELLSGTSFISMRSIASKLVASDELGRVNSLLGVTESVVPLVYAPLYAKIYASTLSFLPGAFYLVGGVLTIPTLGIFWWFMKQTKKDQADRMVENASTGIDNLGADLSDDTKQYMKVPPIITDISIVNSTKL